jgi:hypothetical protein
LPDCPAAAVAASAERIRVGTGGVMLRRRAASRRPGRAGRGGGARDDWRAGRPVPETAYLPVASGRTWRTTARSAAGGRRAPLINQVLRGRHAEDTPCGVGAGGVWSVVCRRGMREWASGGVGRADAGFGRGSGEVYGGRLGGLWSRDGCCVGSWAPCRRTKGGGGDSAAGPPSRGTQGWIEVFSGGNPTDRRNLGVSG